MVFVGLILLNIILAPMMAKCSEVLIASLQKNLTTANEIYCKIFIQASMIEVYIVVVTCIGIFVSRQSAFYY